MTLPNVVIRSGSGTPAISKMKLFKFRRRELDLRQIQVCNLDPTIAHKIFETNSSFHVKWRTTGKV